MSSKLLSSTFENCGKQVGEVFLTTNGNILFFCTLCECKYKGFQDYSDHVMENHFQSRLLNDNSDKTTAINEDTIENNSLSFDLTEDFNVEDSEFLAPPTDFGEIEEVNAVLKHSTEKERSECFVIDTTEHTNKIEVEKKRIYKCPKCVFTSNTYANIVSHAQRHTGKKKYCCTECRKRFYTSTELRVHSRIHTGERPYLCTGCGRTFVTSASLWRHNKICSKTQNNVCTICDMTFKDAAALRNHVARHGEERFYKCSLCRAQFKLSKGLLNHMKLHEKKSSVQVSIMPSSF